jgi:type IV secretion system protein VirD4
LLGSAKWSTDPGHWRFEALGNEGAPVGGRFLLLGESREALGNMHVRTPRQHMISIAPTRSGKGVSLIIPNLLTYRGSVLVVDPKGENAWVTAAYRRNVLKQKTYILDPWHEVNRRYGSMVGVEETFASFNPLSILKRGSDDFMEDLASLADALIITASTREPYFDDTARELWAGLMAYVIEHPAFSDRPSLWIARQLLMKSTEEFGATIESAVELGSGSIAALKLGQFLNPEESRALSSVISAARTQTAFLDTDVLNRSMAFSDFSFEELCDGNTSVYLVLPPDKLVTYARWLRLMVSVGIRAVVRGGGSSSAHGLPALFMLDEFGTIGKLNTVANAYGLMAGLGMIMWAFVQDLNQLHRDYPDHWETFIGNSQALTCFGVMDNFTADYVSKFLGTQTIQDMETQTSVSQSKGPPQQGAPIWAPRTSVSTSTTYQMKTMSRPLLHPDEVRSLPGDVCILMGHFPPIRSRRIVYHEDWWFLHQARADPRHPVTADVRTRALERRLRDAGSVGALLRQHGYSVKSKWRGRWKVTTGDGTWTHTFASDSELWKFTYTLLMQSVQA